MNVVTNIVLSSLAKEMMSDIKNNWESPFSSPIVIFSDSKLEQWFKFYWMKQSGEVLMNLEMARLDTFLLECVGYEGGVLREELLRDMMIIKLVEKDDNGDCYYKSLGSSVVNYLAQDNGVNEAHLFDFASQMAHLFLDYEITRPGDITYEKKEVCFGEGLNSDWQKKLYNDIIGTDGVKVGEITYKTLFQAYKANGSKAKLPAKYERRQIMLFGFSGIGELHREILNKVDNGNNIISLYLQTANITNVPFKNWSVAGYDHYTSYRKENLTSVAFSISEDKLGVTKEKVNDKEIKKMGCKCPSKLREIEVLYSSICKLIQNGAVPQDILVVAPNIGDYRTEISRVFDANKGDGQKDGVVQLRMPYVITDSSSSTSYVAEAVNTLVEMLYDKNLSRDKIFSLLRNPIVQYVRGISNDEVTVWLSWVEDMNIYRDRKDSKDWTYIKRRLLISRLTTEMAAFDNVNYRPYSTLNTQDDGSLYRFVDVIDDLYKWCELAEGNVINKDNLSLLDELLTSFIHRSGDMPKELQTEGMVYASIKGYINQLSKLFAAYDNLSIPLKIICYGLGSNANGISINQGAVFVDGGTFSSIVPNRVMPAKHLFMIGMDSKAFPRQEKDNVLDCRTGKRDHTITERDLDTFFCLLNAAEESVRISYVFRDLKKDDVFYPATPVQELMNVLQIDEFNEVSIDETREWGELFTPREWRNKANFDKLLGNPTANVRQPNTSGNNGQDLPDKVSISQLRDYLADPFVAYANRLFGGDDDNVESESSFFEPTGIDAIYAATLRKEYVKKALKKEAYNIKQELLDSHYFTDGSLAENCANDIKTKGDEAVDYVNELKLDSLELDQSASLSLPYENNTWRITGDLGLFELKENKLVVIELSSTNTLLAAYVKALVIIAQKGEYNTPYVVELHSTTECLQETTIAKQQAIDILQEIYKRMFVDKYHKCVLCYSPFFDNVKQLFLNSCHNVVKKRRCHG